MLLCKTIRVVTVRKEQHLDIHSLREKHIRASQCSLNTCGIAVVEQHDITRKAMEEMYLMLGKSSS